MEGRDLRQYNEGPVGSERGFPSPDPHENDDGTQYPVMAGLEADVDPLTPSWGHRSGRTNNGRGRCARRRAKVVTRSFVALAAVLALLAVACGDDASGPPSVDRDAAQGTEPPGKDFFFDPGRYVGREVTVTGYVSDVLTPVAF